MVDDSEGEISVRGSPALTTEFFYVMRGLMLVASCHKQVEEAPSLDERQRAAREGEAALVSVRDSLDRIPELLNELEHAPDARSMFAQTLAGQRELYEAARASFEAALEVHGLRGESAR